MKKHLILTSLIALVATTGAAKAEEAITMDDVKDAFSASMDMERVAEPNAADYTYTDTEGEHTLAGYDTEDYAAPEYGYAEHEENTVKLASEVAFGSREMTEADYQIFVPGEGEEEGSWVALGQKLDLTTGEFIATAENNTLGYDAYSHVIQGEDESEIRYTLGMDEEENLAWFKDGDIVDVDSLEDEDLKTALQGKMKDYEEDKKKVDGAVYASADAENYAEAVSALAADNASIAAKGSYDEAVKALTDDSTEYNLYASSLSGKVDSKIDAVNGTIHGLISEESAAQGKTTNGKDYKGNLAIGTTTEDHLLALDSAIGDRSALDGDYLSAGSSVSANLQSLNDGLEKEVARATAAEALTLNKANAYTDSKINTLEKNISGGVAAATALSSVAVSNVSKGEVSVGGGYGYYNNQSAMAFGAAMGLSDNWSVNAGAGIASGDKTQVTFRAGTNYKFKLF